MGSVAGSKGGISDEIKSRLIEIRKTKISSCDENHVEVVRKEKDLNKEPDQH